MMGSNVHVIGLQQLLNFNRPPFSIMNAFVIISFATIKYVYLMFRTKAIRLPNVVGASSIKDIGYSEISTTKKKIDSQC